MIYMYILEKYGSLKRHRPGDVKGWCQLTQDHVPEDLQDKHDIVKTWYPENVYNNKTLVNLVHIQMNSCQRKFNLIKRRAVYYQNVLYEPPETQFTA